DGRRVRNVTGVQTCALPILLDPHDPEVQRQAEADGVPLDWIEAAQRSPIHKLINEYKVALPLHPEYRTMPMVWYIPPLSPVVDEIGRASCSGSGHSWVHSRR